MTDQTYEPDEPDIDEETARYARAADEALKQLDWCVKYLYGIRKSSIAKTIDQNRASIERRLTAAS